MKRFLSGLLGTAWLATPASAQFQWRETWHANLAIDYAQTSRFMDMGVKETNPIWNPFVEGKQRIPLGLGFFACAYGVERLRVKDKRPIYMALSLIQIVTVQRNQQNHGFGSPILFLQWKW